MYVVQILDMEDGNKVIREIRGGASERRAEAVERGVLRNLDHDRYDTEIVEVDDDHQLIR